jgi:hypothetical protein
LSEPAESLTLPPAGSPPPAPDRMLTMAAEYGIEDPRPARAARLTRELGE